MIASQHLQSIDGATNGYAKTPQRGTRQIFRLPGSGSTGNTFDLVISDVGACALRARGPAANTLESDFVAAFRPINIPAPQPPSARAGVFIPYGTAVTDSEVRKNGLVNTMTGSGEAVLIYIPPRQAIEVLRNAGMQ
jgi:hypothetical protein